MPTNKKSKNMTSLRSKSIIFCLSLGFLLFCVLFYVANTQPVLKPSNKPNCTDLEFAPSVYCLNDELNTFFKYNISNVGKQLAFEQLKEEGGVCEHYSEWYSQKAKELGYDSREVKFPTGENFHQITIISLGNNYCVVDQTFKPVCYELGDLYDN